MNQALDTLLIKSKCIDLLGGFGGGFTLGTAMGWTSPALPHIADCQEDCDFQFDDITGKHETLIEKGLLFL